MAPRVINEIGNSYGRLIVQKYIGQNKFNMAEWQCLCSCGKTTAATGNALRFGRKKSCGCLHRHKKGSAARTNIYRSYKREAVRRKIEFAIPKRLFSYLTILPCHYCGEPPSNCIHYQDTNGDYIYNGIDRVDNNKGYTKENVVPCCKWCNGGKGQQSAKMFISRAKRIARQHKKELL